jgi:alkanesulfonate monooxygenase SsuD/methylene tetrahydromethanopterin reductase-like flavin-dependent oxidoreductase (luciferase family)
LDVGIFDHLDRNDLPLAEHYEMRLRLIEAYDRLGFYCYHLAEHHGTPIGTAPSPSVFLAAAIARTKRLRFAPLVYLLPFYHPLRLIEEICMLDQLSGGRFEFGTGKGISPFEASYYGIDPDSRERQYEEALRVVLSGLTSETLSHDGEFYHFHDVPIELAPLQQPHPPMWYGLHTPESAARCARLGYNIVVSDGLDTVIPVATRFRETWGETGGGQRMPKIGLSRLVVVADSDEEARTTGQRAYRRWLESFYHVSRRHGRPVTFAKPPDFDAALADGRAVAGSSETVRAALRAQVQHSGVTYFIGQFAFGDLTFDEAMRSATLFARDVQPSLEPQAAAPA